MGFGDIGGGSSAGSSLGSAIAKSVKPKSTGKAVGRAVSKATGKSSSSSSGSKGRSVGRSVARSTGSSGGGSSRSSGGYDRVATPAPKPKPIQIPNINSYLGTDSAYQNVVRGGKRSLADFLSEMGRRRGEAGTQFNQTKATMERDRVSQLDALRQEFASRGLIQSGLFGEEQGRFQQQFTDQFNALGQQQNGLLADLLGQEKNYRRESDLALEAAKQEALARRAAKYKIGA